MSGHAEMGYLYFKEMDAGNHSWRQVHTLWSKSFRSGLQRLPISAKSNVALSSVHQLLQFVRARLPNP